MLDAVYRRRPDTAKDEGSERNGGGRVRVELVVSKAASVNAEKVVAKNEVADRINGLLVRLGGRAVSLG